MPGLTPTQHRRGRMDKMSRVQFCGHGRPRARCRRSPGDVLIPEDPSIAHASFPQRAGKGTSGPVRVASGLLVARDLGTVARVPGGRSAAASRR